MSITLPPLPFEKHALEPVISAETLEYHYGKHHQAYVDNLNKLTEAAPYEGMDLEEIILKFDGPVFNNAAQVWNHTFYWNGLSAAGGGPEGALLAAINRDFGSLAALKEQLTAAASTQFGSGWAWLVLEGAQLKVTKTGNADLPMKHGQTALWTLDVWEHAYYIDYRNARPKYVSAVLDQLMNWRAIAANYAAAAGT